ncbi:DUF2800 domain-containing protein [Clostridium thermobutyricum]|uniref:DUF2800 domain-containing protein n=1 Tax=Clostridium thermobutyricum TaxID=29372 RepID=UPI002942ED0D|nr:DUF2800 domain-containing protein [Clostridium thermobutyricum]
MPDKHAKLSASGSSRWINCPPSVRLEEQFENKTSIYAEEGTLAHELAELKLRLELKEITKRTYTLRFNKATMDNPLYSKDMDDYVDVYKEICMEKYLNSKETTTDSIAAVEQKLDFSNYVPDGFGTGDFIVIADGTLEICDLKYGKGVPVSAENNSQMRLYALGAINKFSFLYDIEKVRMTIIQPRLGNISSDEISVNDLLKWAEEVVKPSAELAIKGEGEFKTGGHCKFCKARSVCRARADENLELAKFEFKKSDTLSNDEISEILEKVDSLVKWASDVKEYALDKALEGQEFKGYKLVEGRSQRKWKDEKAVAKILTDRGFLENIIWTKKLTTISNIERAIGKKETERLFKDLIDKPIGKPTLVPLSDKREVYNAAKADFQ